MGIIGKLGVAESQLGNIILGEGVYVSITIDTTWDVDITAPIAELVCRTTVSANGTVTHSATTTAICKTTVSATAARVLLGTATANAKSTIGGGQNAFVQIKSLQQGFAAPRVLTFDAPVGAGNLIIVAAGAHAVPSYSMSISDNLSHTWTLVERSDAFLASSFLMYWYTRATGGTLTVTITGSAPPPFSSNADMTVVCLEYTGIIQTLTPLHTHADTFQNGFPNPLVDPYTASIGVARELLVALVWQNTTNLTSSTVDSPFTMRVATLTGIGGIGISVADYTNITGPTAAQFHANTTYGWLAIITSWKPGETISGLVFRIGSSTASCKTTISASAEVGVGVFGTASAVCKTTVFAHGSTGVVLAEATCESFSTISAVSSVTHRAIATANAKTTVTPNQNINYQGVALAWCKTTVIPVALVTHEAIASLQCKTTVTAEAITNAVPATASIECFSTISASGKVTYKGMAKADCNVTVTAIAKKLAFGTSLLQCKTTITATVFTAVASAICRTTITTTLSFPEANLECFSSIDAEADVAQQATAIAISKATVHAIPNIIRFLPGYDDTSLWLMGDGAFTLDGNGNVTTWEDQSNSGNHNGTQSSTFARPTFVSGELNGLPIVRFNGSNRFLNVSSSSNMITGAWTIIAVVKDSRADNNQRDLISNVAMSSIASAIYLATVGTSPTKSRMTDYFGGSLDQFGNYDGEGVIDIADPHTNGYFIYTGQASLNGDPTIFDNDLIIASASSDFIPIIPVRDNNKPYTVGRRGFFSQNYWHGDIAELIVWDDELSGSQVEDVLSYLKTKWFGTTEVTRSRSTTWNSIEAEHVSIGPQEAIWNTYELPHLTTSTSWNAEVNAPTLVDAGPQSTTWHIREVASKTGGTTWDVEHLPITEIDISTTWNVLHRPTTDVDIDTTWKVKTTVEMDATSTTWRVLKNRNKIRTTLWNDYKNLSKTESTSWNANAAVAKSADTTWTFRAIVTLLAFPRFVDIPSFITVPGERSRWNVENNGETLTTNLQQWVEYDVHTTISKTGQAIWNDYELLVKTRDVIYDVHELVGDDRDTTWNIQSIASRQRITTWQVRHLELLRPAFWNVCTHISKSINTTWKVSKYNSNASDAIWNVVTSINDTRDTTWNVHPEPIQLNVDTTWGINGTVAIEDIAVWDVQKKRRKIRTTYWNVITGRIDCDVPIESQHIRVKRYVRWNAFSSSNLTLTRVCRWNTRKVYSGTTQRAASWRVLGLASDDRSTIWRITLFTTDVDIDTTWNTQAAVSRNRTVDFNVHVVMTGTLDIDTSWSINEVVTLDPIDTEWNVVGQVSQSASPTWNIGIRKQADVSWNVNTSVSDTRDTTWAIGVGASVDTTWNVQAIIDNSADVVYNVHELVGDNRDTTWNVQEAISVSGEGTWDTKQVVGDEREAIWWTSTVSVNAGTSWNAYQIVQVFSVDEEPGIPTLWMNFPVCNSEFIQAEYKGSRLVDGALLPKITVCDIANDYKIYRSKYDKTHKRRAVQ